MTGEPITYHLLGDDIVTLALLGCFFLFTMSLAILGRPWGRKIAQMPLLNIRQNDLAGADTPSSIQASLLIQMVLVVALLLLDISIRMNQRMIDIVLPSYVLLAIYASVAVAFLAFRWVLYRFVLWLFVQPGQTPLVMQAWVNSVCIEGVLMLSLMMIDIYYSMSLRAFVIYLIVVSFFARFWFFYWLKKLFCLKLYGSLLIFLYFCALELVPILFIGIGTRHLNRYLLFNY